MSQPIKDITLSAKNSSGQPVKSKVTIQPNGVANLSFIIPTQPASQSTTATATATFTYAQIIEAPSYTVNDDISKYTIIKDLDNPSAAAEYEIDSVLGYSTGRDTTGGGTGLDMRDFVPWLKVDEVVPILTVTIDGLDYLFFWQTFNYVGEDTKRSVAWNETENRIMSVFR